MKTVVIFSGGMDSTTLVYHLKSLGHELKCISFNYGQRHSKELLGAAKTCKELGIEHQIVDLKNITKLISNSSLTGDIETPHGHYEAENMKLTVVPSRNTIMASIALGWVVNLDYDAIALGVHAGDHAIYPDCRPEYIDQLRKVALLANFKPIDILTPFLFMDKGDIAIRGKELGVLFENSWTCYEGKDIPCGLCGACQERAEAFTKANAVDPLIK